jgi:hypothetical protein
MPSRRSAMLALAAMLTLALAPVGASPAGEARTVFAASATVLPLVSVQPTPVSQTVWLTQAECDAGLVIAEIEHTVRSNDPRGYELRFAPRQGYASAVEVVGLQAPVVIHTEEVSVQRRVSAGTDRIRLTLRARLIPGMQPGRYPLPVVISATTIQ